MQYRVVETELWQRTTIIEANTPEEAAYLAHSGTFPCDTEYIGDTEFPIEVYGGTIGTTSNEPYFIERSKL